jgi:hypothetical protein
VGERRIWFGLLSMAMLTGGGLLLHRVGRRGDLSARNRALRGRSAFSALKEALALSVDRALYSFAQRGFSPQNEPGGFKLFHPANPTVHSVLRRCAIAGLRRVPVTIARVNPTKRATTAAVSPPTNFTVNVTHQVRLSTATTPLRSTTPLRCS